MTYSIKLRFVVSACALASMAILTTSPLAADDSPKIELKKKDKIIFLGDSITEAGVRPKGYVTLVKEALTKKYKDLDLEIVGAGISGNKVPDLEKRVQKDVIDKKPTIVVIYIGINDVWHGKDDPKKGTTKERFESGLKEVIGKITNTGAQVILCTPTVIGEKKVGENDLDDRLNQYADISRAIAKDLNLPMCDLRKSFVDHIFMYNKKNKDRGYLTTDTVHLNDAGNKLVADEILKILSK
jgi:isoamyl acetate esterase